MNETLLPCPFCGGAAKLLHVDHGDDWFVRCKECDVQQPSVHNLVHTKKQAIAAWNRRNGQSPKVSE